jgi:hypothetical protein
VLDKPMIRKFHIDRSNFYRAILTDTLPYELPLFFSNEYLFTEATRKFKGMPDIVCRLLKPIKATIPFSYRIQKGGGDFRKITIIHPSAQLKCAELYGRYDKFIVNACNRSRFSLRYPSRVGSHYFQKQYLSNSSASDDFVELDSDPVSMLPQRRWASTYFSYKNYNPIYRFFLSEEFSRLEQKYKYMLRVDIARCFESIYTHSIAWALRGKDFAKENKDSFFESDFDKFMQYSNWGETNGIPIGAEVSRIFAEIILQSVDLKIERDLVHINNQIDIRRYVDDYYAFANTLEHINEIKNTIGICASFYNLHLNEKKTEIHERPLVSKMAIARHEARSAVKEFMLNARKSLYDNDPVYFSNGASEILISRIRSIARSNDTEYNSLASPILAVISRELRRIVERIDADVFNRKRQAKNIISAILRLTTFVFHTDIRVTTTHKVAKIFYEAHIFVLKAGISAQTFDGLIVDIVRKTLQVTIEQKINGPEVINLLVAADSVCRSKPPITPAILNAALGHDINHADDRSRLSYFDLVSVLYFSRNHYAFTEVRRAVNCEIERRIRSLGSDLHLYADSTMLFFDYLSCPYIKTEKRISLFTDVSRAYGSTVGTAKIRSQFLLVTKRIHFVTWEGSNQFGAFLERRELHPAYDL